MDDAPTGDLDLSAVTTRSDLAALLRAVHLKADKPSLRTLEAMTRHSATPLSKSVAGEMLRGQRFPRKAVMVAFLLACGMHDEDMEPWRRTWERVASGEEEAARLEVTQAAPGSQQWASGARSRRAGAVRSEDQFRSDDATSDHDPRTPSACQSMWHFPDGSRITLVCYRLTSSHRPPSADPSDPNYVRYSGLADLDTVMDVYGAIRAYNPASRVIIMAAQELTAGDLSNHLILIGGLAWMSVTPWFSRIFPIPIETGDSFERGAIVVHETDGADREFKYTFVDDNLVEDVGFFAYGKNPSAPRRTLTICGGITTRGVHGAARCFIDWEMRERNERYLTSRFPDGSTYCIVMRVPVANNAPLTPDLSKKDNRLFEWCDTDAEDK